MITNLRKWATGWTATIILVPLALWWLINHWNRPQLSILVAKAFVGSDRSVRPDGVHDYRAVVDLGGNCVTALFEHFSVVESFVGKTLQKPLPRLVYGVYLENSGRSELTDIRLAFRSREGTFQIAGSPQLELRETESIDPERQTIRTVSIAVMAPKTRAVIVASVPVTDGHVTIDSAAPDQSKVGYSLGAYRQALASERHVRFAGARQLSDVRIKSVSVDELFTRQRDAFELKVTPLPIDPFVIFGGGKAQLRGPFRTCSSQVGCDCYTVQISQQPKHSTYVPTTPRE